MTGRTRDGTRSGCAATWARRFAPRSPACGLSREDEDTVLTGAISDQAELYGVLAEIEALGLELLEVRRVPPR